MKKSFKKSMSVFLAILMIMSAWVWVAPEHAHAVDGTVSPTALTAIYNGSGDRGDSSKIVICSDGEAGNTTVGHIRFNISSFDSTIGNATLTLSTGNHGGTQVSNCRVDVYAIKPNQCQASSGTYVVNNIANVYGSTYNSATGVTNALNYYGLTTDNKLGTFYQSASSATIDVTSAVQSAKSAGQSEVCFLFIMPEIFNDGNGNSWSDTHIKVSGTSLSYTKGSIAASNTGVPIVDINMDAANSVINLTTDVTTIYGSFENDNDYVNTSHYDAVYHNVLYTDGPVTISASATSAKTEYGSSWTGSNGVTVYWYHPTATLMYDGDTSNLPRLGVAVNTVMYYSGTWSRKTVNRLSYVSTGGNGFTFNTNWKGSDGRLNFQYMWHGQSDTMGYTTTVQNDSLKQTLSGNSDNHFYGNLLKFTDTMGTNEYWRSAQPTFGFYGDNGDNGKTITATTSDTLYIINYVPLRTAIEDAITKLADIKANPAKYSVDSVAKFASAAKALVAAKPNNYINSSKNDVSGWATAAQNAVNAYNSAKNLELATYDVSFENIFSISSWINSNSSKSDNASVSYDAKAGTITVTGNNDSLNYCYTKDGGANIYTIPVTPSTSDRTFVFECDVVADAQGYIIVFDTKDNKQGYDGLLSDEWTPSTGKMKKTFTIPAGCDRIHIRFGSAGGNTASATFSNIAIYDKARADAIGMDEWTIRPITKPFEYGTALGTTLDAPARTGYTFVRWHADSINPNIQYDAGEEVTDGNGNVVSSLHTYPITQNWVLYSDWIINEYTIKFVNAAGVTVSTQTVKHGDTPVKPANTAANYDSSNHYAYSWPTVTAATGDTTYNEIKTPTAHSLSSVVTEAATCTDDGVRTYTCSGCDYSYTEAIDATGHTEVTVAGKAATCTESGLTDGKKCSTCGATTVAQQTIDPLGHLDTNKDHVCDRGCGIAQGTCSDSATDNDHLCDYGCGKTLEACSDKTGDNDHKCDVCGADNITDHIKGEETKENITEATCGSAGKYDSVYYCTECNTEMERTNDVTIEQKPHNWQDATYSWTADGKSCTVTRACANDADHTESETVNATGVQNVAPTCEAKGSTLYTAKFTATWAEEQTKEVYDIPENGHTPAEAVIEKNVPATCTEDGSYDTVVYCSVEGCEKELSRVTTTVPATGHTSGAAVVENNVDATCTTDGSYDNVTYCTVCGAETGRTTIVVPQKGHTPGEAATCTTAQICTVCDAVLVAALKHEYNSVVTDPTCTEGGYTTYTCTRCSDTYTDDKVEALGHEWNDATCIAPKTCSVCGETEGEALGHTWTAATCTASKTCSVCGETEGEALGHKWNDATCTAPKTCSVCGETEGEALGHKWNDATCTTPKTCSVCGETEGSALGHDYKAVVTDPTCTDKGFTTHTCSRCSDSYVDTYVDALEHAWSDTYTMESNGKDGKHYQICTRENCSVKNESVAHTWNDGVEDPKADCENAGTMTYTCTAEGCGATYTESVSADGHSLGEWVEEIPATCVAEGTKGHYECSVCHKYFAEDKTTVITDLKIDINENNHDLKTTEAKAPTCTEDGWDEYVTCKREGCDYTTYSEKGKLGHAYGKWTFVADGEHKRVCANDENHVETEACADSTTDEDCLCDKCGELVVHSYGNATCDAPAKCTVCGDETGDKLGHDYTVFVETVDYTCEADGYTVYKCSRCDATENRDITNAAHRPEADYTVMQKATCEEDGYKAILCSMCKDELETETITKRAHVYKDNGEAKAATCLEAGEMNIICTNIETDTHKACVHKSTKVIPMLDHSYTGDYQWNNYADKAKTHSQKCVNGCNEYGNETECTFEDVVTPATCYVNGYTTYTCSVCNSNYQSDYTTRTHDYAYAEGNGTSHGVTCEYTDCNYTATENCSGGTATCTALATCEKCNTAWGEKNPANHTGEANVTKNYKDATCSAEGYTGDIHWSCCDALETKGTVVGKLAHTEATREENRNEASCGADGSYDLVTYCSVCTTVIKTEKQTIPATGKHNYATEKERVEPTCQNEGYYVMACGCGTTEKHTLETVDHKYETYTNNGDATCQKNATETAKCSFGCGATDTREVANSKVDHNFETYTKNNDATCQKNETETASCSFGCNETHTREIAGSKVGHKYVTYTKNNDATCQNNATETANCAFDCGKTDTRDIADSKAEHKYTTYTSDNNAKCEEDGTKTAICDYGCETKHTVTDAGSKLNHNYDTTKSEENLTRPVLVDGTWTKGYYTYSCKNDASHTIKEEVDRASYTAYEAALANLNALLATDLTAEAKTAINTAIAENKVADNLITTEQSIIDAATAKLEKAFDENNSSLNVYKVTFKIEGSADVVVEVISGNAAIAPTDVKKAYNDTYHYTFTGWDKDFTNVTSDLTVTAEFDAVKHTYAHTAKNDEYHTDSCDCGYEIDVKHSEKSEVTTKASCDAAGVRTYTCSVCNGTRTEAIAKREHHIVDTAEALAPTCSATGIMNQKCDNVESDEYVACTYTATRVMDKVADAHKAEADYTVMQKATCEADGYKAILCEYCDKELSKETIEKREHVYTDNGVVENATCLEVGVMNTICTNEETDTHVACVHESTREIKKLDHSYTGDYKWNNATATKTHSQKCVNGCNEYGNETECEFEVVVIPATCYKNGYTTYTCKVCSGNYQADYTTREHICVYAKDDGTKHVVTCEYEDCNYTATENCSGGIAYCNALAVCEKCNTAWGEKDATNHTGEANVTKNYKDATCSAEGYTGDIHWSCCDALETKGTVVGKLAHTEATREENRNEASCGADGSYDLVTYCSVCKEVIKTEKKTIPVTGKHNYATEKERVEPTCQNEGYYVMACGCGTTKTYELETVDHKYLTYTNNGDATCQNNATETAKCSFKCGATDTREIENSKVGHKYETYVRNNDATCQKNETETASCSFGCNETHTREIAGSKVGHKYVTYTKNNDATCQKNETETASCSFNCGKTDTREIANSKAEHKYTTYTSDNNAKCEEDGTKTALCDYGCETTHTVTDEGSALNHDYDTTKSEANLTRPALVEGVWTKGYYTYTCKNDADHKDYEYVERASYTAYDVAVETLTTLLEGSTLTDDAKADIENALNANKIDDNYIATSAEQKIIDDATARLNVIIKGIEDGTLLKAYFDAALEDLATAKKLADEKDVIAATITKIASIEKAIADLQEKDVDATAQPVIDALEDQLEEIIVGIKSGTLLRPDYKDWNEAVGVYNGLDKSNVQDSIVAEAKDLILEIAMKQGDPNLTLTTATQNRIDEATARLNAIVAGIKDNTLIKPNYADAQAAIANAEALGNKLSKDEKTALVEQKDALTEIMSNPDSNKAEHQNDVDAIKAEVQKIIDKYAECVSGNHNWSAPVLTTAPTAEAQGEYTETCGTCAEVQITKVTLADYDDFNAVVAQLNVLSETENLKAEAVETIADALAKAEALDKNLLADVTVSGNVIKGGQDEIDALVAELNEVADTMNAAITDGSLVKVDYTAADEAIKAAEKDLDGGKLTDSDKATLDNLKRQLDEIKNNPASNKKDNQATVDAIKNTAEAIADKYAGCANGNHSYKVTTVAPTCENEGYKLHTCTVCGKSYKDSTVGALGHIEVILPAVDATCGHNGYTEGVKCSSCGEILTAQQIIPSLPHTDADDDGICDECNGNGIYDGCQCACHKDSGLFKIIYAILRILWKIFKINPSCACGRVHY